MSDEIDGGAQAPNDAPIDAQGDDGGDDEQVVLTRSQIDQLYKSARNSAAAELRRAGEFKRQRHIENDPRVQRGLALLAKYEAAHQAEAERLVELEGRAAANPFQARVMDALQNAKGGSRSPSASQPAQPAAQPSELSELITLMKLQLQQQMVDKLPKAPITYANPVDEINAGIRDDLAAIPEDDPRRGEKIQQAVFKRLKTVKVRPGGSAPAWAQQPPTKK